MREAEIPKIDGGCKFALTPREKRNAVVADVAAKHGLPVILVMGRNRQRAAAKARWEAMARLRDEFGDRPNKLARFFGRDHTTVLHGLQRWAEMERT